MSSTKSASLLSRSSTRGLHVLVIACVIGGTGFVPASRERDQPRMSLPMVDQNVDRTSLDLAQAAFKVGFKAGDDTANLHEIKQTSSYVRWKDLRDTLDRLIAKEPPPAGVVGHGVMVLYGLVKDATDNDYEFVTALKLVTFCQQGQSAEVYKVVEPDSYYTVHADGTLSGPTTGTWQPGVLYFAKTYARRYHQPQTSPGGPLEQVIRDFDTQSFTFQWEKELTELESDNRSLKATYLQFRCMSEPLITNTYGYYNLRHHLCAVMLDEDRTALISDSGNDGIRFKERAADVGSPCPEYCGVAYFPAHGISVVHY